MAKFAQRLISREMRLLGESIGEIARYLNVSKSTVSRWCEDIEISETQKMLLLNRGCNRSRIGSQMAAERKKKERASRVQYYQELGLAKVGLLSERELFLVGAALYWAEGDKKQRRLVFVNSDVQMVKLWIRWLSMCLKIPTIRLVGRVGINEQHSNRLGEIEKYWSHQTGIPRTQFTKTSLKHSKSKKVYDNQDNYFGSLQITVKKGTNLSYEMLGFIQGLARATSKIA